MSAFPQFVFSESDFLGLSRVLSSFDKIILLPRRFGPRQARPAGAERRKCAEKSDSHAAAADSHAALQVVSKRAMSERGYKETTRRTAAAQRSAHRALLVRPCV